jgi:hypothetical protein
MLKFGRTCVREAQHRSARGRDRESAAINAMGYPGIQRTHFNNQALLRFTESCPRALPGPALCPFGGACHACPARVQAKLTVSHPGDRHEQEADRVAAMPEPKVQRACPSCEEETLPEKPLADQITPLVQRQEESEEEKEESVQAKPSEEIVERQEAPEEDEEEQPVQAKHEGGNSPRTTPGINAQIQSLRGGGAPLAPSTRGFFEQRFGNSFGDVRVHSGPQAAQAAKAVRAQAFTLGRDIVFGQNRYAPESPAGQKLLAHELAHVIQQNSQPVPIRSNKVSRRRDPLIQRSSDSSKGKPSQGPIPKPEFNPDGTCKCRVDLCWRGIHLWYVPSAFKHGFFNTIDSKCRTHNIYVDPSKHDGHSHAEDKVGGWDTSGEICIRYKNFPCKKVDKLSAATKKYEALDVVYHPVDGPNSNSFLEWIFYDATGISLSNPFRGLIAWDYYRDNPKNRNNPPRFAGTHSRKREK